jgi:hypothetical protein
MPAIPRARAAVHADEDVLQDGHLVEQPLVLEGARDTEAVMAWDESPAGRPAPSRPRKASAGACSDRAP